MPTALGRRSVAVHGEKPQKTRLVRIYCYGNTLYKGLPPIPFSPGSNLGGDCFFFFNSLFFNLLFLNLLFFVNLLFFFSFKYFFLINLKGLCHGFLFLHKSRSPRGPLIMLRVNSFLFTAIAQCSPLLLLVAERV